MLSVVVFNFSYGVSKIVTQEICLADCQCSVGNHWGMQDISYKQNLLDLRKYISHEMAERKLL